MEKPLRYRMKMQEMNRAPAHLQAYIAEEMDEYLKHLEDQIALLQEAIDTEVIALALKSLRADNDMLKETVLGIARANYRTWDDGMNSLQDFHNWVQSRCQWVLKETTHG
jgi:hypothetical protein